MKRQKLVHDVKDVHKKHLYYLLRSSDQTLSPSKRAYASKRLKQLEPLEMSLEKQLKRR